MYLLAWDWTNWSELLIQFNLFKSYQPGRGWGKFLDHLVCSVIFQLRWISQNIELYHIKPFSQPEVLIWFICTCSITFWEIIRFRGVSNFVVFVGRPHPWIYILNENDFEWVIFFTETENLRIHEITSPQISKKHKIHENWPRN